MPWRRRRAEGRGLAGRQRDRLRGAFAAKPGAPTSGPGALTPGPASPSPACPLSGSRPGARRPWFDVGSAPLPPHNGLLHEGRDLLARGCAYCTKAPPTWSTPNPPPVAPCPRALQASHHPSEDVQPKQHLPRRRATTIRPAPPVPHRCLEMPRRPALERGLWSGPPAGVVRRHVPKLSEARSQHTCEPAGSSGRPALRSVP